jgi:D-alanine--D-alanine ligase
VIVKPNAQGSTVGLSFVERPDQLDKAVTTAFAYDDAILIEEWVKGTEISVPVAGDQALPAVEIVPASGRYDFEAKYTPGATEEVCPARIAPETAQKAAELALRAHQALGCRGITRTDMIVASDRIVVLEVNTLPGMTSTSLVPKSAGAHGWSFNDLVKWMVEDGLKAAAE